MSRYEIRFGDYDESSTEHSLTLNKFSDLQFNDNHSTTSDWSISVPTRGVNWKDLLLERVYVWDNTGATISESIIYIGLFEKIENNRRTDGTVALSGRGVLAEDLSKSVTKHYTKQFTHETIEQFGTNEISFQHSINTPSHYSQLSKKNVKLTDLEPTYPDIIQETGNGIGPSFTAVTYDWTEEQFDGRRVSGDVVREKSIDTYSADSALRFGANNTGTHSYFLEITEFEHSLDTDWEIPLLLQSVDNFPAEIRIIQDGTLIRSKNISSSGWHKPVENWTVENSIIPVGTGSTTFEIEVNTTSSSQSLDIDVASVVDTTYTHSYPTTLNGNGYYNGPEMFPQTVPIELKQEGTKLDTGAELVYNVNDVSKPDIKFSDFSVNIFDDLDITTESKTDWVQFTNQQPSPTTENNYVIKLKRDSRSPQNRTGRYFMQALEYIVLIPFRDPGVSFNVSSEYDGGVLDVFGQIHDDSAWRFANSFEETVNVTSFITGEQRDVPASFKLMDESLETDVSDYANKVTVVGANGLSETVRSQSEIAKFGKTVERVFNDSSLTTQSSVKTRAKQKINETIANRDESGELTSPPTLFDVGYSYVFENFESSINSGEQVGKGTTIHNNKQINFIKSFDGNTDSFDINDGQFDEDSGFEILIQPDLSGINSSEYYTLASSYFAHDFLKIYGDGRIGIRNPAKTANDDFVQTNNGVIDETMQRITVITHKNNGTWTGKLWVDGGNADSPDLTFPATERMVPATLFVGIPFPQKRIHRQKLTHQWKMDGEDFNSNNSNLAVDAYGKNNPINDATLLNTETIKNKAPTLPSDKDLSNITNKLHGIVWADNGNKLFIFDYDSANSNTVIHEYNASKPYQLQTISRQNSQAYDFGFNGSESKEVFQNEYGTWMMIDNVLFEFETPYDVTTISPYANYYIENGDTGVYATERIVGKNNEYYYEIGENGKMYAAKLPDRDFEKNYNTPNDDEFFDPLGEFDFLRIADNEEIVGAKWLTDDLSDTRIILALSGKQSNYTRIQVLSIDCQRKIDIGNATADFTIRNVDLSGQLTTPTGIETKPDGSRIYIPTTNQRIVDIWCESFNPEESSETAQYDFGEDLVDIQFSESGNRAYVVDSFSNVLQFNLSTAFDVSTASYDDYKHLNDGTVGEVDGDVSIDIAQDGTKLYAVNTLIHDSSPSIQQYTLSKNYDVTSASLDTTETLELGINETLSHMHMSNGGEKLYLLLDDGTVREYSLSNNYNIGGEIESQFADAYHTITEPALSDNSSLELSERGTTMYIQNQDTVYEYTLGSAFDITTVSETPISSLQASSTTEDFFPTPKPVTLADSDNQLIILNDNGVTKWQLPKGKQNLTITNGCALSENGRYRFAARFSDTTDGLRAESGFGTLSDGAEFSLSLWIRTRQSNQTIIGAGGYNTEGYRLYIPSTGGVAFDWNDGTGNQDSISTSTATVSNDEWHHISVSLKSNGESRIEINGVTKASHTGANPNTINPSEVWHIGNNTGSPLDSFTGRIDDVRWYTNDALSKNEVSQIYDFNLYDSVYGGTIDDIRVWDANFTNNTNIQALLDNTNSNATEITRLSNNLITYWQFESQEIGTEYDIKDTSQNQDEINAILSNLTVEVPSSSLEEVSYNLSSNGGDVSLKFDISDRIDVVLNNTQKQLESIQNQV